MYTHFLRLAYANFGENNIFFSIFLVYGCAHIRKHAALDCGINIISFFIFNKIFSCHLCDEDSRIHNILMFELGVELVSYVYIGTVNLLRVDGRYSGTYIRGKV